MLQITKNVINTEGCRALYCKQQPTPLLLLPADDGAADLQDDAETNATADEEDVAAAQLDDHLKLYEQDGYSSPMSIGDYNDEKDIYRDTKKTQTITPSSGHSTEHPS